MKATVVDLRYRMNDVLKALNRNESVSVLYRGRVKGVIRPAGKTAPRKVTDHPFFNSRRSGPSPDRVMEALRGGRNRDL